jgi:tetratricopeptide (TPR) repeat protein
VELRAHAVGFRHELSRRAVESALPAAVRMQCNARMLAVLLAEPHPDLTRLVHHAVAAGDEAPVIAHAPAAARAASRLGAHAQEVALQEQALRHRQLLDPGEEAALWQQHAAALTTLGRIPEALEAGRHAVRLSEYRGEPGPLAAALTTLALVYWAIALPRECLANAERAVQVLAEDGDSHQHAYAPALRSTRPGCAGTGARPRTVSPNVARRTSKLWSSPTPATSPPPSKPCAYWTTWARVRPPRYCADDCGPAASPRYRAGPPRRRAGWPRRPRI